MSKKIYQMNQNEILAVVAIIKKYIEKKTNT